MIANLQSHYGFTRMPFTKDIPVPALFSSAACKEAVARLRWLVSARGLGVLTGEVGSGKTVALRAGAAARTPPATPSSTCPTPRSE
jgi:type II secretory pathway predicted ATPase ExeA